MAAHPLFVGIFGIAIYLLEAWAFYFKSTTIRIRALQRINGANDWITKGHLPPLPRVMIFGRVLRSLLRVFILSLALRSIINAFDSLTEKQEDMIQGLWFLGVIFEGILMRMTRIVNRPKATNERNEELDKEMSWRRKRSDFLKSKFHLYFEVCADFILLITALMFSHTYWRMMTNFFMDRIDSALSAHIPMGNLLWTMFVTMTLTSIVLVVPSRLAFWVEDAYAAVDIKRRRKVRWSVVFACFATMAPVLWHFIRAIV